MDGIFQQTAKAALLATLCCGCLSGEAAQARTAGAAAGAVDDGGGSAPAVAIRSPAAGAVAAGEIAVYAEAVDDTALTGVQFLLDGARLGAEDTTPPYSITWDTATGGDGVHALTALARHADGRMSYSTAVSVMTANESSLPPGMTRIEETSLAVVWSDNWIDSSYGSWSGGSAKHNVDAGSYVIFTFQGAGVRWIGYRGRYGGIVKVYIDGAFITELDTYRPQEELSVPVYSVAGLKPGIHSLLLELTEFRNEAAFDGEITVDAFDVFSGDR